MSRSPSELAPAFPPGFQRDAETLFLLHKGDVLSRDEVRENLSLLGVVMHDEDAPAPPVARTIAFPPPLRLAHPAPAHTDDEVTE